MRIKHNNQYALLGWSLHGLGILLFGGVCGAYYWAAICPLEARATMRAQHTEQLQLLLQRAEDFRARHHQLSADLNTLRESVATTLKRLPIELGEDQFIEQVRSIASGTGIAVAEHHIGTVKRLENFGEAEIAFICNGSFGSICRFLDSVSHLSRLTEISRLEIEPGVNSTGYSFQVTFVLYFGGSTHDRHSRGEVL